MPCLDSVQFQIFFVSIFSLICLYLALVLFVRDSVNIYFKGIFVLVVIIWELDNPNLAIPLIDFVNAFRNVWNTRSYSRFVGRWLLWQVWVWVFLVINRLIHCFFFYQLIRKVTTDITNYWPVLAHPWLNVLAQLVLTHLDTAGPWSLVFRTTLTLSSTFVGCEVFSKHFFSSSWWKSIHLFKLLCDLLEF